MDLCEQMLLDDLRRAYERFGRPARRLLFDAVGQSSVQKRALPYDLTLRGLERFFLYLGRHTDQAAHWRIATDDQDVKKERVRVWPVHVGQLQAMATSMYPARCHAIFGRSARVPAEFCAEHRWPEDIALCTANFLATCYEGGYFGRISQLVPQAPETQAEKRAAPIFANFMVKHRNRRKTAKRTAAASKLDPDGDGGGGGVVAAWKGSGEYKAADIYLFDYSRDLRAPITEQQQQHLPILRKGGERRPSPVAQKSAPAPLESCFSLVAVPILGPSSRRQEREDWSRKAYQRPLRSFTSRRRAQPKSIPADRSNQLAGGFEIIDTASFSKRVPTFLFL